MYYLSPQTEIVLGSATCRRINASQGKWNIYCTLIPISLVRFGEDTKLCEETPIAVTAIQRDLKGGGKGQQKPCETQEGQMWRPAIGKGELTALKQAGDGWAGDQLCWKGLSSPGVNGSDHKQPWQEVTTSYHKTHITSAGYLQFRKAVVKLKRGQRHITAATGSVRSLSRRSSPTFCNAVWQEEEKQET